MRKGDWIEFTLNIGCGLNCLYCPQPLLLKTYDSPERSMTVETFKTILDHVPMNIGVDFSGYSDPCLHPDFITFFQIAFGRGYTTSLYTTFEGLSKDDYDILRGIPFEWLSVHLPDVNEMVHVKWTSDYAGIVASLRSSPPKCKDLDLMTVKGPLHPKLYFLEPVRVQYIQPRSGNVNSELSQKPDPHSLPIKCARGHNLRQNVVLPDGNVYLCCCDYGLVHHLGNLKTQTYEELEPERLKIIERQKKPDEGLLCRTCEFAER